MNRQEQIETLLRMANKAIKEEIEGFLEIEREPEDFPEGYDELDAFNDFVERSESNSWNDGSRPMRPLVRSIEIALGKWRVVTEEELKHTVCTGKPYSFIHHGKKYKYNSEYKTGREY